MTLDGAVLKLRCMQQLGVKQNWDDFLGKAAVLPVADAERAISKTKQLMASLQQMDDISVVAENAAEAVLAEADHLAVDTRLDIGVFQAVPCTGIKLFHVP